MQFLSQHECSKWLSERQIGFSLEEYPLVGQSEALEFRIEGDTRQLLLLAYLLTSLEQNRFNGGLLVFREWNINSPDLNRIGYEIVRRMLRVEDDGSASMPRPVALQASEATLVPGLLLQAAIFGWDAFYVPTSGEFVVFVSHDELLYLISGDFSFDDDIALQIRQLATGMVELPYYLRKTEAMETADIHDR